MYERNAMNKGKNTKENILEKAYELFAIKGYAKVTMQDICESTELSRGGLYRYFSSTKDIFIQILNRDIEINSTAVNEAIQNNFPAIDIFQHYLNHEKRAVFSKTKGFYFAIHEFAFIEPDYQEYFNERVRNSCKILSKIFSYGQSRGEFKSFDIEVVAKHILHFWDSLKTSSTILIMTETEIEKHIDLIKEIII